MPVCYWFYEFLRGYTGQFYWQDTEPDTEADLKGRNTMTRNIGLAAILATAFAALTSGLSPPGAEAASVLSRYEFAIDVTDLRLSQVTEIVGIHDAARQGQSPAATRNHLEVVLDRR